MGRRSVIGKSLSWNVHASLFEKVGSETLPRIPRQPRQRNTGQELGGTPGNQKPQSRGASTALYDDGHARQVASVETETSLRPESTNRPGQTRTMARKTKDLPPRR